MSRKTTLIIPAALATTTLLTGAILTSTITKADGNTSSTDAVSITVDSACTMTGGPTGESTTDNTYSANVNPGSSTEITGSKLVTVCNDSEGYSIYATGFSGDSYDTNNTKLLSTIDHSYDIDTAVAPVSPTPSTPSSWAMKLEAVEGLTPPTIETGWDTYHVIPSSYTQIAEHSSNTSSPSSAGATVQTKYQVYISSSQIAGSYEGKVKYTMVHPDDAPAPTPPAETSCNTPVPNLTYMQDLNSSNKASILAGMTEDQQYFLKDKRDEKEYCVAKLKDGNIWMTQNLDHDIVTDGSVVYNSTTTDLSANATWIPDKATYATNDTTWHTDSTGDTIQESYDAGELYWNPTYKEGLSLAQSYIQSCVSGTCDTAIYEQLPNDWKTFIDTCDSTFEQCDMSLMPTATTSTGDTNYHLGNYYNWTAAIAMNDSSSYTTQYQDANQSICPANWTLPKSGNNTAAGSFQYLITQYGWDSSSHEMKNPSIWESPIKSPIGGYWVGTLYYVGETGSFWSPMLGPSYYIYIYGYYLGATSDGTVYPDAGLNRNVGFSVRCVSR